MTIYYAFYVHVPVYAFIYASIHYVVSYKHFSSNTLQIFNLKGTIWFWSYIVS